MSTSNEWTSTILFKYSTCLDLLEKLKEADAEIELLKGSVKRLQSITEQYVPVKGDAVDIALADYLNN